MERPPPDSQRKRSPASNVCWGVPATSRRLLDVAGPSSCSMQNQSHREQRKGDPRRKSPKLADTIMNLYASSPLDSKNGGPERRPITAIHGINNYSLLPRSSRKHSIKMPDDSLPLPLATRLLEEERDVFEEGKSMHSIYTCHYHHRHFHSANLQITA